VPGKGSVASFTVYRDVLDDVWTTARVICLNSHQLRDKTVGRIWKRPNTYRPARRRVFAKKSSPPPDCKKINVILLWATSRRNVVIGKYLPHPLVSRRRKARTGTGTRRGCGDRLFDLRGFRRKRGRSGPACWERRDGQFRRAHFASAVLCGIFEDSDWGANNAKTRLVHGGASERGFRVVQTRNRFGHVVVDGVEADFENLAVRPRGWVPG
jgi:hypothetical protein